MKLYRVEGIELMKTTYIYKIWNRKEKRFLTTVEMKNLKFVVTFDGESKFLHFSTINSNLEKENITLDSISVHAPEEVFELVWGICRYSGTGKIVKKLYDGDIFVKKRPGVGFSYAVIKNCDEEQFILLISDTFPEQHKVIELHEGWMHIGNVREIGFIYDVFSSLWTCDIE